LRRPRRPRAASPMSRRPTPAAGGKSGLPGTCPNTWRPHVGWAELQRRDLAHREDGGINLTARWLNTIGLAFGIVGVLIIFRWGPPQPNFDEAAYLSLVGPEAQHNVEDVKRLKRQYQMMS